MRFLHEVYKINAE